MFTTSSTEYHEICTLRLELFHVEEHAFRQADRHYKGGSLFSQIRQRKKHKAFARPPQEQFHFLVL